MADTDLKDDDALVALKQLIVDAIAEGQAPAQDSRCGELLAKWRTEISELLEMSKDDEKYHAVGMACLIEAKKQCADELAKAIAAFEASHEK